MLLRKYFRINGLAADRTLLKRVELEVHNESNNDYTQGWNRLIHTMYPKWSVFIMVLMFLERMQMN
jgi:hypothetical protein